MNTQRFVILRFGLGILLMAGAALAENEPPEPKGKAGLPFTEKELVSLVRSKQVSETILAGQVEERGVAFCPGESSKEKLLRAGAGPALVKTVARVGEDRVCKDVFSREEERLAKKLVEHVMSLPSLDYGHEKLAGGWWDRKFGWVTLLFGIAYQREEGEALTRNALAGKALVEAWAAVEERHRRAAGNSPAQPAEPERGEKVENLSPETLIARAGSRALQSGAELPSLTCLEATKRSVDFFGRGELSTHDRIVARLTRRGPEETYKVVTVNNDITTRVNNRLPFRFDEQDVFLGLASRSLGVFAGLRNVAAHALNPFETVKAVQSFKRVDRAEADTRITARPREFPAGPVAMEEFLAPLRDLFQPERGTKPHWVRSEIEHGRQVEVFDYEVADMLSSWKLPFSGQDSIHVAYRGRVWVDRASRQVERVSLTAADLPEDFAITAAQMDVTYEEVEISGRTWLLPRETTVVITQGKPSYPPPSGGVTTRLEIGFRGYREAPPEVPAFQFSGARTDAGQAWVDFCARSLASGKSDSLYTCRFDPLGAMAAGRQARRSADSPVPEHLRPENQER